MNYPFRTVKNKNAEDIPYYYFRYKDAFGKTHELTSKDPEKLAQRVAQEYYHEPFREFLEKPKTVQDYLLSWLEDVHMHGKKPKTREKYLSTYHNHIENTPLGLQPIKGLNVKFTQKFYNDYFELVGSANLVKEIHKLLKPCLRYAYGCGDIERDFSGLLKLPRDPDEVIQRRLEKGSVRPLTLEQQLAFVRKIAGHPYEALFRTALDGGYRSGELLALTWKDIDFQRHTIHITKSWSYSKNFSTGRYEGHTVATKNYTTRKNRMPKVLEKVLRDHKEKQAIDFQFLGWEQTADTLVFCNGLNHHLDKNNLNKQIKKVFEEIGVNIPGKGHSENKSFHDLRHTYATRQFEAGVEVLTVSRLLGHRNVNTTLETYIHVLNDLRDGTADVTDSIYDNIL